VTLVIGAPDLAPPRPDLAPARGPSRAPSPRHAIVEIDEVLLPRDASGPSREECMDNDALFAQFVREQTATLLRSAYLLTGNATAAEDLVQDTFARLFPKWDRVQSADVPMAYVRRSMVNGFLNQRRRPASRELVVDEVPERIDGRDIGVEVTNRDLVWRLLATLPDRQRAALVMRFFDDLADEEIAGSLGCRLGTVRSLISRGLAALREQTLRESAVNQP
jgi:RNA polymerase sigma-70 factor (sigma-E family)